MQTATISKAFAPRATDNLVRLGDDFDGGYVVDKASVEAADILIALGVGDSWGFEEDCLKLNPMPLEAYDPTVGLGWYWREFGRSCVVFFNHKFVRNRFRILKGYYEFFRGDRRHHRKFVGEDKQANEVSLAEVLKTFGVGPDKKVFLKIDIEGSEYRILETLIENAPYITGLAIEFHDFDLHQHKIKDFIKRFGLTIAHIHCNNCAPIANDGQPMVVEISFTQTPGKKSAAPALPHPDFDMPNEKKRADYAIQFA